MPPRSYLHPSLHTNPANPCLKYPQTIDHYITYSVITSDPALTYTSVLSTIRCYAVTTGPSEGATFVTWSGNFSSDADAGVYTLSFRNCASLLGVLMRVCFLVMGLYR